MQAGKETESAMAMRRTNTRNQIKVILWGKEIGTLTWLSDRKMSYFFFSDEYFRQPYDLCPLTNPKGDPSTHQAIYGVSLKEPYPESRLYQGLPPFLADSLPDQWGNAVFDKWFAERNIPDSAKTPITKLSFLGNRAMGAFEFIPMMEPDFYKDKEINLQELYGESMRIEEELSGMSIRNNEVTIKSIAALGTSPGGSRKKAVISIAPDGSVHSGKVSMDAGWKHCIIKFNTPRYSLSETEFTYWELAKESGIRMMPSYLYEIEGTRHFLTERFDRMRGRKILMQTLAAINPEANSYEDLFKTCRRLDIPMKEITGLYRQTVFNFLMNNTDDHKKNFSFVLDEHFIWHLSPAYDITFIIADNGIEPQKPHCFSLKGKYENITEEDLVEFGKANDIAKPESIVKEIRQVSLRFEEKALKNGINGYYAEMISRRLNELGRPNQSEDKVQSIQMGQTTLENIRFEMSTKGNIHLCAKIQGKERKKIVTNKNPLYDEIIKKGFNLMDAQSREAIFRCVFDS